jgi:S-adenosylmethionine:tRNA-ribosyltransferase-isomerase (queuine synthetase)
VNQWQVEADKTGANEHDVTGQVSNDQTADWPVITKHFNWVVAENCMKCEVIHPKEGVYDFTLADQFVNKAKAAGHNICAVGISTIRATESSVGTDGMLKEFDGWTNKFIFPPYDFGLANTMITNFYHPESTMMMATAAFAGYELTVEAYKLALKHKFMFGCYGDAMLILDD